MPNGFVNFNPTIKHGPIYSKDYETDGSRWIPATEINGTNALVGTFTLVRNAGGDYSLNLTAAANSPILALNINEFLSKIGTDPIFALPGFVIGAPPTPKTIAGVASTTKVTDSYEGHIIRGIQLTNLIFAFSIATAPLTTHTATLFQTTYGVNLAPSVATKQGPTAIGAAITTNVAKVTIPVTTPYILGANASGIADYLEINITNPGTSVYKLYGIGLLFNYCLL